MENKIKIDYKNHTLTGHVQIMEITLKDSIILYVPSLELSSYGDTRSEAKELLDSIMFDYSESLFQLPKNELINELGKYGWKKHEYFNKRFKNESFVDKEGVLKNFDLPLDTPIHEATLAV